MKISKVDEYNIREYSWWFQIAIAMILLYMYLGVMSNVLLYVESSSASANILHYKDAFWCLRLASNTIGYGDFYPVTELGRWVVTLTFYIGAGIVGIIVGVIARAISSRFDNSIQNRELRKQNAEILELLQTKL